MSRALKFTVLSTVMFFTFWVSGSRTARASYDCFTLNGTPCTTVNSYVQCTSEGQYEYTCTCNSFRGKTTWLCPY